MHERNKTTNSVKKQPLKTIDMFPEEYSKKIRPSPVKTFKQLKQDFNLIDVDAEDIMADMHEL
jgi:hypothetical protein